MCTLRWNAEGREIYSAVCGVVFTTSTGASKLGTQYLQYNLLRGKDVDGKIGEK